MRSSVLRLSFIFCMLFMASAAHGAEERVLAPDANDIYWADAFDRGGEDVTYDPAQGQLKPIKKRKGFFLGNVLPGSDLPQDEPQTSEKPMIAIVIDDVGVNRKQSMRAVENLKWPVTLSYLPYAQHVQEQVKAAKAAGHEVILHLPWEPDSTDADPGPHHLSVEMEKEKLRKSLLANLDGFEGYDGVNNHMGSKFSRYKDGLGIVMAELKKRGVFFLDSKTTADSLAEKTALEYGVPATHRDVFLDHVEKPKFVEAALKETEKIARRKGSAIAIGHPKDITVGYLESWMPTLEAKGFQIVTLSRLLEYRRETESKNLAKK